LHHISVGAELNQILQGGVFEDAEATFEDLLNSFTNKI
jgi:hypothetical protein